MNFSATILYVGMSIFCSSAAAIMSKAIPALRFGGRAPCLLHGSGAFGGKFVDYLEVVRYDVFLEPDAQFPSQGRAFLRKPDEGVAYFAGLLHFAHRHVVVSSGNGHGEMKDHLTKVSRLMSGDMSALMPLSCKSRCMAANVSRETMVSLCAP